jgi:RNA polymerase sigma-70 factor (ECF subfamily)
MPDDRNEFNALLQRMRAGEPDAARELLERYGRHILYVIRRRLDQKLRSKFDSVDFLQDVWASFFTQPPEKHHFDSPEALFAYLTAMARHKVADAARQRLIYQKHNVNREHSLDGSYRWQAQGVPAPCPTPSEEVSGQEQWERLLEGRPQLQQRILTMLRQGHTHAEIAGALDLNEKTVRRLIQRLAAEHAS